MPPLIGLVGRKESGKSTVAYHLSKNRDFEWISFATPIKAMIEVFLHELGYDDLEIKRRVYGCLKEEPVEPFYCTARHLMQTLGTEWGRDHVHEGLWTILAMKKAHELREIGHPVVIDDVRFPNEAEAIKKAGGVLVKLYRKRNEGSGAHMDTHASEQAQHEIEPDYVIGNDASLDVLYDRIGIIVDDIFQQATT